MKTFIRQLMILTLLIASGVGCSKKETKAVSGPVDDGGGDDDDDNNPNPVGLGGATANFTAVSLSRLEAYAGRSINNPTNVKVNVDVFNVGSSDVRFGGTLKILYTENGRVVTGTFNSGTSLDDTKYNKWHTTGGKQKFKAMFQDSLGALVVIIEDEGNDLGTFKGKVYFRNFDFGVCSNPPPWMGPYCNVQAPKKCWNITLGPYDCRAFMSGSSMRPETVDLPGFGSRPDGYAGPGYQELGSFTGLDVNRALNLN